MGNSELRPARLLMYPALLCKVTIFLNTLEVIFLFAVSILFWNQNKISYSDRFLEHIHLFLVIDQWNICVCSFFLIEKQCTILSGAYAPLTREGNIMVDGILVSCYADVHHDLGQLSVIPLKWFMNIIELIFGDDPGFPVYVNTAKELSMWMPDA